jgi:glycosyltransferase involved in cell wall biosynthesis
VRRRLVAALRASRAQPDKALLFLAQRTREEYLRVNLACDVMVDSLHWSGGNTSLDALHCGLPVVTIPCADARAAVVRDAQPHRLRGTDRDSARELAAAQCRNRQRSRGAGPIWANACAMPCRT